MKYLFSFDDSTGEIQSLLPEQAVPRQLFGDRLGLVEEIRRKTVTIHKMQDALIFSMAELADVRHGEIGGHIQRTAGYLDILAQAMRDSGVYASVLTGDYIGQLVRSATLHDIGKIGISDATLLKRGLLDEEEREYMKLHTTLGAQAISRAIEYAGGGDFLYTAYDMALSHHEWWNGTGYPNGIAGEEIPLCARIVTVADVYDALTSDRVYRRRVSHENAVDMIMNARGTQFEPDIADVFREIAGEFKKAAKGYHHTL